MENEGDEWDSFQGEKPIEVGPAVNDWWIWSYLQRRRAIGKIIWYHSLVCTWWMNGCSCLLARAFFYHFADASAICYYLDHSWEYFPTNDLMSCYPGQSNSTVQLSRRQAASCAGWVLLSVRSTAQWVIFEINSLDGIGLVFWKLVLGVNLDAHR